MKIFFRFISTTIVIALPFFDCMAKDVVPADIVFRGGYVYTVDKNDTVQEAVAIRGGIIVYVGKNNDVQKFVGKKTKVIQLAGHMLMPGLVDGHLHSLAGGKSLLGCDLHYAQLSIEQVTAQIQACLDSSKNAGNDKWLEVANWDRQSTFAKSGDPTKAVLDALNTSRPILVTSTDFHTALANSRALNLAGITATTIDPNGGKFLRDGANNPTGICEDQAGFVIRAVIPDDTDSEYLAQGRAALKAFRQAGITTFMDAASTEHQSEVFSALQKTHELTARVQMAFPVSTEIALSNPSQAIADIKALTTKYDQGPLKATSPGINTHVVKIFGDGVVNAPADTGGLLSPYLINNGNETNPNWVQGSNTGAEYFPPEVMKQLLIEALKNNLDVHVHATGERTVRHTLDAVQNLRLQFPLGDFRPSIAHAETVDTADYPRFKVTDTTATMSFQWGVRAAYSIGDTENHLGADRFSRMEPSGSLFNAGARISYGSDWPIDPLDEFLALKAGVTRSGDPQNPHSASSIDEKFIGKINTDPPLSRATVLRAITMNSAYQLRMENQIGSIEVGKFADLIVLDNNFMTASDDDLARNKVLITMTGGKIVMASELFAAKMSQRSPVTPAK